MRTNKKLFFLILLSIGALIAIIPFSRSFSSGSYADNHFAYDFDMDFGTHDWIALNAINYLKLKSNSYAWLSDRLEIVFLGTEAPDNAGVNDVFDGENVKGFGDTSLHHNYYKEDGSIVYEEDDSSSRARLMGQWASGNFSEGKLDLAAYYIGAMTHYISDLAVYAHIARNNVDPYPSTDFDEHHAQYESYIQSRTNDYNNLFEFFSLRTFNYASQSPYDVSMSLGWDTYKDPNPAETTVRDAKWMHDNFFTGWALTVASRVSETDPIKIMYYDRVEESLNNAIQACIYAINRVSIDESTSLSTAIEDLFIVPSFPIPVLIISVIATCMIIYSQKFRLK
ncbi:MAG: hypothetical protein JW891_13260 [Candidatus Lokiarchaeota archaeon]|nr:hypothetical protein [Candidatus Lokiarchaeota archaeon]